MINDNRRLVAPRRGVLGRGDVYEMGNRFLETRGTRSASAYTLTFSLPRSRLQYRKRKKQAFKPQVEQGPSWRKSASVRRNILFSTFQSLRMFKSLSKYEKVPRSILSVSLTVVENTGFDRSQRNSDILGDSNSL